MFNTSKWFKKFVMVTGFVAMGASVGNIALAAPADDVIFDMSQKVLKDLKIKHLYHRYKCFFILSFFQFYHLAR